MAPKRAHKFTRERVDLLLKYIGTGTRIDACRAVGISYETLLNWEKGRFPRNLDDDQKALKEEFQERLEQAEGRWAVRTLSYINQAAAQGDWKAAAWMLERRRAEEFGKQSTVELTGKDGGPIELSSKSLSLIEQFAIEEGLTEAERQELQADVEEFLAADRESAS